MSSDNPFAFQIFINFLTFFQMYLFCLCKNTRRSHFLSITLNFYALENSNCIFLFITVLKKSVIALTNSVNLVTHVKI